jgi:hypothetical protein
MTNSILFLIKQNMQFAQKNSSLILCQIFFPCICLGGFFINPYNPDGSYRTHGTHAQIFIVPCIFNYLTGIRCPGCGLTTSCSLIMHGDFFASIAVNAGGLMIMTIACVVWMRSFVFLLSGYSASKRELSILNYSMVSVFIATTAVSCSRSIILILNITSN